MKHKDVKIGGTYLTRIGMNLCPVVVVSEYAGTSRKGFHVRRVGSDTILPKMRTAAGLREQEQQHKRIAERGLDYPVDGEEID
jgi:hypothetical protein